MIDKIRIGSKWSAIDRVFIVTGLQEQNNEQWVFYKNISTEDEFSCLVGAFTQRFSQILNEQR